MQQRMNQINSLLGKSVHVVIDRPIGHQHKGLVYPINYGYIPGMMGGDGEEQDAYILGVNTPLTAFDGQVIGAVIRKNDVEDKLIIAPEGTLFHQGQIAEAVHFQEQHFDTHILSLFHKSCGVLPYRVINSQREYLLVFEQFSKCWSLPKGHMEAGETESQTALRELWEETGLTAQLDTIDPAILEYPISPIAKKQVVVFSGQVSGTPRPRPGEIDGFKWVAAEEFKDYLRPDTIAALQKLLNT